MAWTVRFNPQREQALALLADAMRTSKQGALERLLDAAVADTPAIRAQIVETFRRELESASQSYTEPADGQAVSV
jgi:hypothetical protein